METESSNPGADSPEGNVPSNKTENLSVLPPKGQSDATLELHAFNAIVSALHGVPENVRPRLIKSVFTFLGYTDVMMASPQTDRENDSGQRATGPKPGSFSEDRTSSPKEFLFQKKPVTDIERMACLAFYLTHYRDTPHFKTLDLSKLNTEAAQIKFANAASAVDNAASAGLLVAAGKGAKQISALGEQYVQFLPDRDAAKAAIAHAKPRRKNRRQSGNGETKD